MKNPLPPTYFFGAIVLMGLLHLVVPLEPIIPAAWRLTGILPIAIGLVISVLADRQFKQRGTTVKPFEESRALVTDGMFAFSRNPMYVGFVLVLVGLALCLGSITAFPVIPIFIAVMDFVFIRPEEKMLEQTFGDAFNKYRKRVRRWI